VEGKGKGKEEGGREGSCQFLLLPFLLFSSADPGASAYVNAISGKVQSLCTVLNTAVCTTLTFV